MMPLLDRFWWLRLFRALIFATLALGAGAAIWGMVTEPAIRSAGGIAIATLILLVFGGYAAYMAAESLDARRRKRLRLAVLRGVPLDLLPAPQASAFRPQSQSVASLVLSLRLLWREGWYLRVARGLTAGYSVVMLYGLTTVVTGRHVFPLPAPAGLPHVVMSPLLAGIIALLVAVLVFILAGRPYGVVADEEGLRELRRWGPARRVRWSEARLFEARRARPEEHELNDLGSGTSVYVYALTSPETYVSWHWPGSRSERAADSTDADTTADGASLIALIAARTGLRPQALAARKPQRWGGRG